MLQTNQLTTSFGDGDVLLWMLEFFLFVIWFWLLLTIFSDLFRDHEMGGEMKALWVVVLIVLPYLGILIYLIARGHGMSRRAAAEQARVQEQLNAHIRSVAGAFGPWGRGGPDLAGQVAAELRRHHPGGVRQSQSEGARRLTSTMLEVDEGAESNRAYRSS